MAALIDELIKPIIREIDFKQALKTGWQKKKKGEEIPHNVKKVTKIHNEASNFIGFFNESLKSILVAVWILNTHFMY